MDERTEREDLEQSVSAVVMAVADRVKFIMSYDPSSLSPGQLSAIVTACTAFEAVLDKALMRPNNF